VLNLIQRSSDTILAFKSRVLTCPDSDHIHDVNGFVKCVGFVYGTLFLLEHKPKLMERISTRKGG